MLEGYTTLGFVAAQTRRVTLGLLVTGVTYRHPGLLAKTVTTLDVLSGGRARLGIGAAWYEREHLGLGVPFPPISERFERLEETLRICRQMWSDDDGPFDGKHYQLAETICSPPPISRPSPKILDRRERRAEDPAARRAVRRRVQPLRTGHRDGGAQARRPAPGTARPRAATSPRSRRRSSPTPTRSRTPTASSTGWSSWPPSESSRSASHRWAGTQPAGPRASPRRSNLAWRSSRRPDNRPARGIHLRAPSRRRTHQRPDGGRSSADRPTARQPRSTQTSSGRRSLSASAPGGRARRDWPCRPSAVPRMSLR